MKFNWDRAKAIVNLKKHKISFEEARTVFESGLFRVFAEDSNSEERFIAIGFSLMANLLIVVHCYRDNDEVIRIISARKATKKEAQLYKG
jgi:uncharacterized protein